MQSLVLAFLTLFSLTPISNGNTGQVKTTSPDHATIQRRRIVLVRSAALVGTGSHKKRAVVTYPVVTGLNPPVLRRVQALLDFKNIFDYSLKEYREDTWLDEFSYAVNHNANYLLDITFSQSGSAAYPDDQSKHFLIDLRGGRIVKASDAFEANKLASLSELVNKKLQAELKQILVDLKEATGDPEDARIAGEAQESLQFKIENLDDFSVNAKGVSFLYDAGYPHVIRAFEPNGKYFFTYSELKPYIKRDGPLGQFIH
jgi:hypothetical protein